MVDGFVEDGIDGLVLEELLFLFESGERQVWNAVGKRGEGGRGTVKVCTCIYKSP